MGVGVGQGVGGVLLLVPVLGGDGLAMGEHIFRLTFGPGFLYI